MSAADLGGAAVRELWRLLDDVQEMGFSLNPLDLVHNIQVLGRLIERAWEIASEPPPGDPAALDRAASSWRRVADGAGSAGYDLDPGRVTAVWSGPAGGACTLTFQRLGARFEDAASLARLAAAALDDDAEELTRARAKHDEGGDHLRAAARRLGPCPPWEIPDMIGDVVRETGDGVRAFIESYRIAEAAATACIETLHRVADEMPFPDGSVSGMSVMEVMNVDSAAPGRPPLLGDVLSRAQDRYDGLGEGAREMVDQMLADAPSAEHRAGILAALASGASLETLANFADRIGGLDAAALATALDPTEVTLIQQSDTTCGSASLTVARMLNDPVYSLRILTGYDATTGATVGAPAYDLDGDEPVPGSASYQQELADYERRCRFHEAELQAKQRTNDAADGQGGPAVPWVDALGTSPWGAAEELNGTAGGSGYSVALVDSDSPADRQEAYDRLERAGREGRPAVVYSGNDVSPRHVVLVVGAENGSLRFYEPGSGTVHTVTEDDFVSGDVDMGGWERPWAVVAP